MTMQDPKKVEWEFGGPIGATALMIWSHLNLFYFYYCYEANSGSPVIPTSFDDATKHFGDFRQIMSEKAVPASDVWIGYLIFFIVQIILASFMPGQEMHGLPTAPKGDRLRYLCNGYSCYYTVLGSLLLANYLGYFRISSIVERFGEYLVAAMTIADVTALLWYVYGLVFGDEFNGHSALTGNVIYDFFMGSILYPRIGVVDIKMVAECRWSWITLMIITSSCAFKEYETYGYVSANMAFMLVAHWLYSNACAKGEHCIPCTWDMFHENYGWMLNFWNICGVPFMYCYQSLYILRNHEYLAENYPGGLIYLNFAFLFLAYFIFDSANSQKASCKVKIRRKWIFPQVPWAILDDPIMMETPKGRLLVDGWYAFARKIQYTSDIMMALSWGIACGFKSFLPYFYCVFFTGMINHRQARDEARCSEKYGEHWVAYKKRVPNVFLPSLSLFKYIFTGKHPHADLAKKSQ